MYYLYIFTWLFDCMIPFTFEQLLNISWFPGSCRIHKGMNKMHTLHLRNLSSRGKINGSEQQGQRANLGGGKEEIIFDCWAHGALQGGSDIWSGHWRTGEFRWWERAHQHTGMVWRRCWSPNLAHPESHWDQFSTGSVQIPAPKVLVRVPRGRGWEIVCLILPRLPLIPHPQEIHWAEMRMGIHRTHSEYKRWSSSPQREWDRKWRKARPTAWGLGITGLRG